MSSSFPCTKCGACCRRMGAVHDDWPVMEDGTTCLFLRDDDTCGIYEERPLVCRVDDLRPKGWPVEQWHRVNAAVCNEMQEEDGMNESYRVKLHVVQP